MHASPVVFCERTGSWAAAFRRVQSRRVESPGGVRLTSPRVIETRSAAECREVAAANRGSFVVVELEPSRTEQALDLLFDLASGLGFESATAVVADRRMRNHEWLARELGAQAFIVSRLELDGLYELVQRYVADAGQRNAGSAAVGPDDVRQRIWDNLPWG